MHIINHHFFLKPHLFFSIQYLCTLYIFIFIHVIHSPFCFQRHVSFGSNNNNSTKAKKEIENILINFNSNDKAWHTSIMPHKERIISKAKKKLIMKYLLKFWKERKKIYAVWMEERETNHFWVVVVVVIVYIQQRLD